MHPHRVEVLDRAHDDDVVAAVAHHLELELLPAEHAALDQGRVHRRQLQRPLDHFLELGAVVGDAAARAAQRERRPDDGRIAELLHGIQRPGDRRHGVTRRRREADSLHGRAELRAIFGHANGPRVRADQLDTVLLEGAVIRERHGDVERGLAAHGRQQRVGPLPLDDLAYPLGRDRLDVRPVGQLRVGHDGRGVRIHEDDLVALFLEGFHRLRPRVVEFRALADDDGAGPEQQNALEISAFGHRECLAGYRRACGVGSSPSPHAAWRHRRPGRVALRGGPGCRPLPVSD